MPQTEYPWNRTAFKGFEIVGMNHYYMNGKRCLYVAMIKSGTSLCIQEDGDDGKTEQAVWESLRIKALKL